MSNPVVPNMKKIPVILDTDIGTDIDDTWALAFLLKCPELDVKLITTGTGDTFERAKITARLLEAAGRTDIPIGIGLPLENSPCYQREWVKDYSIRDYPGRIYDNGIQALVDVIRESPEPVTILGISPLPNLAAALIYEPAIVQKTRFIGMLGSVHKGYFDSSEIAAEYNVKLYPHACRRVISADWEKIIAPLDTSGVVQLKGEKYQLLRGCNDRLMRAVFENYACWTEFNNNPIYRGFDPQKETSILYDLVPVYLAFSEDWINFENLGLSISDEGYTLIDDQGDKVKCATTWRSLAAFEDFVISRLTHAG